MYEGEPIIGEILSDDGREILVLTQTKGKIYISKSLIKEISEIKDMKSSNDTEYSPEGPFTTRYAFTTNALPIKKNVNYAMVNLFGPEVHFAVTNNLSLGIMTTWIGNPAVISAKYTFKTKYEKINLALGSLTGGTLYNFFNSGGLGSLNWLTITQGTRINNISFSAGYLYTNTFKSKNNVRTGLMMSIAGIIKIGKKSSLYFDSMLSFTQKDVTNTYYNYYNGTSIISAYRAQNISFFIMPGFRYQQSENKAFQFSFAGVMNFKRYEGGGSFNQQNSFPIPMCSWFYKL